MYGGYMNKKLEIIINFKTSVPFYEQIVNQIKASILNRELDDGELLPSVRTLAKELEISILTVQKAFESLRQEGIIESVVGKGNYVKYDYIHKIEDEDIQSFESRIESIVREAKKRNLSENELINLVRLFYCD
jgi:GntR family transcriptional regulator